MCGRVYDGMKMAKWKRDVFTVREAVPNWFEASEEVNEPSEVGCVSAEIHEDGSTGQEVANKGQIPRATLDETYVELPTRQEIAHRVQSADATSAAPSWVEPEGRGVASQATTGSTSQFGSTWSTEAIGWLGAAKALSPEVTNSTRAVPAEGSEERHNQTLNAFWDLLKRAGYEEL